MSLFLKISIYSHNPVDVPGSMRDDDRVLATALLSPSAAQIDWLLYKLDVYINETDEKKTEKE